MRQCSKCSEYKSLSSFYSQRKVCKDCYNKSRKDKYNSDKEFRIKRAKQIQQYKSQRESSDSEFYLKKHLSNEQWYYEQILLILRASQFTRMFPFKLVNNPKSGFLFMNHAVDLIGKIKC